MKKINIMIIICFLLLAGCNTNSTSPNSEPNSKHETQTHKNIEYVKSEEKFNPFGIYIPEIDENIKDHPSEWEWYLAYCDYVMNDYEVLMGYITLGFVDLNNNGIPELIIYDDSKGTLGGRFTIVTIINGSTRELFSSGLRTLYIKTENDGKMYFYRNFNSLNGGGGTFGYGYVSVLQNINGDLKCTELLRANISGFSVQTEESELFWNVYGEADVLKCHEFQSFLSIQKCKSDGEWEDITADEYLRLKHEYLGNEPEGDTVWNLAEFRHECFDLNALYG